MSLKYEPSSEPLHISANWLFLNTSEQRKESGVQPFSIRDFAASAHHRLAVNRYRANMAHIRQSRPYSSLDFQGKAPHTLKVARFSLGS